MRLEFPARKISKEVVSVVIVVCFVMNAAPVPSCNNTGKLPEKDS